MSDTGNIPSSDVLARICADTRAAVAQAKTKTSLEALRSEIAARQDPPRGFGSALKQAVAQGRFGLDRGDQEGVAIGRPDPGSSSTRRRWHAPIGTAARRASRC